MATKRLILTSLFTLALIWGLADPAHATPAEATQGGPAPIGIECAAVTHPTISLRCQIGASVRGRPIIAERQGTAEAARVTVVSGQMHGTEWPGPRVVDALHRYVARPGSAIWTVRSMNPDGQATNGRDNARGVDLNRNFDQAWAARPRGPGSSGSRAFSEPEASAMARFLAWVQPDLVVSLHGFLTGVDTTGGGAREAAARRFSALSGITPAYPVHCDGPCHGNLTVWYTSTSLVGGVAFTVELPRNSLATRSCPAVRTRRTIIDCTAVAALFLAAPR